MNEENRHIDVEEFVEWCESQAEMSISSTARYIGEHDGVHTCRIREEGVPEDIQLVKSKGADSIRFKKMKQYRLSRREVEFHDKTMIIKDRKTGKAMTRAGTGTKDRRGPFPF